LLSARGAFFQNNDGSGSKLAETHVGRRSPTEPYAESAASAQPNAIRECQARPKLEAGRVVVKARGTLRVGRQ